MSGRTCDLRCKRCGEAVQSGVVILRAEEQRDTWLVKVVVVLMMWLYPRSVSYRNHVDIGIQNPLETARCDSQKIECHNL